MLVEVGHSPDADDAFMFYALTARKIDTGPLVFRHVLHDIETLNRKAAAAELPMTALSVAAYPDVAGRYLIMPNGGSFGDGYGPVLVGRRPMSPGDLEGKSVAIPGLKTSAALALSMCLSGYRPVVVPFDRIVDSVLSGDVDAGLLIHEGQLTYADQGLHLIVDLGVWWRDQTAGLPLPLGVNVIRRDLGPERIALISRLFSESVAYAFAHRSESLDYAMKFSRGLAKPSADRFVGMYVNDLTVDMGERGRAAIRRFLGEARIEFADAVG
ncbi:ABC transporter substrate-binding protein [bacterium]|nr:ABC transporter substrate-binding protein [bacterium]